MVVLRVEHTQMAKTATALNDNKAGLAKSIARMNEALEPLKQNWYQSGSPTGAKVAKHQLAIDEAMRVITQQLGGTATVIADHSTDLKKRDIGMA
jgi:hypothetical protein